MLEIDLQGEHVILLPERALWWAKEKTLIVADLHWGKTAHFRKHGIAVPIESQNKDELRLAKILQHKKVERLVIAGDLFHSNFNLQVDIFRHFRSHHQSLHIDLVIGNHDILHQDTYENFRLTQHKECFTINPFCIAHDFLPSEYFVIHGHVHPAIRIKSKGHHQPALKLCCFAEDERRLILPAFGQFTGSHIVSPENFKHIFLIAKNEVIQWT